MKCRNCGCKIRLLQVGVNLETWVHNGAGIGYYYFCIKYPGEITGGRAEPETKQDVAKAWL